MMEFVELKLKLSKGALRTIREQAYCAGLACNDGPLVHAWVKVIDAFDEGRSECEISLKEEREKSTD